MMRKGNAIAKWALMIAALVASQANVWAHALWIETENNGKAGVAHEVKVFYGEYAEGEIEPLEAWYSDVKEFELWLVAPNGKKTLLERTPQANHYLATFTPSHEGTYTLAISHSARDLGGKYLYQFNTSAQVLVGQEAGGADIGSIHNELLVVPDKLASVKQNKLIKGRVFFKGKPAAEISLEVASPTGWTRKLKTDEHGFFAFEALWEGAYLLEASFTEKVSGEHHGQVYENFWRCGTVMVEVR